MEIIDNDDAEALLLRIVQSFGNGGLRSDKYVFEQILHLPDGFSSRRMTLTDAVSSIADDEVLVVLDPHPNNAKSARLVAESVGAADASAFRLSKRELPRVLAYDDCDMYITDRDGNLLAVGCHEDPIHECERKIWVPVRD